MTVDTPDIHFLTIVDNLMVRERTEYKGYKLPLFFLVYTVTKQTVYSQTPFETKYTFLVRLKVLVKYTHMGVICL